MSRKNSNSPFSRFLVLQAALAVCFLTHRAGATPDPPPPPPPCQDSNCWVASTSTNCSEGSVVLTNVTVSPTNYCPNSAVGASVSQSTQNGSQVLSYSCTNTCGSCTNCPGPQTNALSPTIVSNYWIVTGVSANPSSGTGTSASFTPTNCGNGTITFYTVWQHVCDSNTATASASGSFQCGCPCSWPIPDSDWTGITAAFPNLIRCDTCKQDNQTPYGSNPYPYTGIAYNCLAWCLGDTTRWWWPEADSNGDGLISTTEMAAFLSTKGVAAGTIAFFGPDAGNVVHVARKSGGSGDTCKASSKLGQNIRLSHDLHELEGGAYNNIVGGN